jgi:hypothetical protein
MTSPCVVRTLAILLAVVAASSPAFAGKAIEIRESPISRNQVLDPTHLQRHSPSEVEVIIVQQARGSGLLSFHLDGRPVAKLDYGDWVRLYLEPRRYRFGVAPSPNFGRAIFWQMTAEIAPKSRQLYKIFQSAGFTSSGGNAVYEISPVDFPLK